MSTQKLGRLDLTVTTENPGTPTSVTRLLMSGRIDDSAPLSSLLDGLTSPSIVIDTDGVVFVNSIGVREWMRLLRGLAAKGCSLRLERIADVLITQMNMIPDVRGTASIASFHAQYVCPSCGYEAAPLIDAVKHAAELAAMKAPPMACGECDAMMELGDYPERYLTLFK
jgi:hypothetical protein